METNLLKHAQTQIGNVLCHQTRGLTAIQLANRLCLPAELINTALDTLQSTSCLNTQKRGRGEYYLLTDKGKNMNTDTPKTTPANNSRTARRRRKTADGRV